MCKGTRKGWVLGYLVLCKNRQYEKGKTEAVEEEYAATQHNQEWPI